jgi:glycosyltransferase involved in cell wall biosynthesis
MNHSFVAIGEGGATFDAMRASGAEVVCLNCPTLIPSVPALSALFRSFRAWRPAVVHTHGAEANFHGLIAAFITGVPVRVGEEIGIPDHSWRARLAFRQIYRTAHRVIGISDAVRNWLIESGEVPEEKAVRIYNPVRLPRLRADGNPSGRRFRIAFVGRLSAEKNPLALVQAMPFLISNGVPAELWIVGDGKERAAIEARISELGLVGQVRLFGYRADPAELMRECDIYVQPSFREGFGIALVEAMGCGLPPIVTPVGGMPEIVENDVTGWVVGDARPETIATALLAAWRLGPTALVEIGVRARRSVEGRFEPSRYVEKLERLYCDLGLKYLR